MVQIRLCSTSISVVRLARQCRSCGRTLNTSSFSGPLPTPKSLTELMLPTIDTWREVWNVLQLRCGNSIDKYRWCLRVRFYASKPTPHSCSIGPVTSGRVRLTHGQLLRRL